MRRLIETERQARPGIDDDALANNVHERVRELLGAGDSVVAALSEHVLDDFLANRAHVVIALWGQVAPHTPHRAEARSHRRHRQHPVQPHRLCRGRDRPGIYGWLFGYEALYVHEMELRVEAAQRWRAHAERAGGCGAGRAQTRRDGDRRPRQAQDRPASATSPRDSSTGGLQWSRKLAGDLGTTVARGGKYPAEPEGRPR